MPNLKFFVHFFAFVGGRALTADVKVGIGILLKALIPQVEA